MSYELEQKVKTLEQIALSMICMMQLELRQEFMDKIAAAKNSINEELTKRKSGEEAAEDLERFVNCISMRAEIDKFAEKVTHGTHRTLHQSIIGLMFKTILKTAESQRYDGRNESAVMTCRMIEPIIKNTRLPFI